jgi:uncharacterized protein with FMN-binding domain
LRRVALTQVSSVAGLVLLLTLKANTTHAPADAAAPAAVVASAAAPTGPAPSGTVPSGAAPSSGAAAAPKTVVGSAVKNQYESFQVKATVTGGKISKLEILNLVTNDQQSKSIAGRALPKLEQASLAANSAGVDTVSGATFTSKSYKESLQAALDQAGL